MRRIHSITIYRLLVVWVLLSAGVVPAAAQEQTTVKRLSIANGLSNNSVRCIYQDKRGFIWFATYDGLNRYDGREFRVYRNKIGDSTSLPHNYIYTLFEDRDEQLWVGTGRGLAIFNHSLQRFSPVYFYRYNSRQPEKINISLNSIGSDLAGNIFIGTSGWGLLNRRVGETVCRTIPLVNGAATTGDYTVSGMFTEKNNIWVFVSGHGLSLFDEKTQTLKPVSREVRYANCLYSDSAGLIRVGTENGLYSYAVAGKKYIRHFTERAGELSDKNITAIGSDQQNNLWIGTDRGGITVYNKVLNTFSYIASGDGTDNLSSETVSTILRDRESRIWIGTIKGGCNIVDVQKGRFTTIARQPFSNNTIPVNTVYSFCEDSDHNLLIGTDGGGLSSWNRNSNRFTNYKHEPGNPASLSHNSVTKIMQDYSGIIWVATYGGGISQFNKATGRFTRIPYTDEQSGLENRNISLLYEDNEHTIWTSGFNDGRLSRYDRKAGKFVLFDPSLSSLISMKEDRQGNLWAGNSDMLIRLDRKSRKHTTYSIGRPVRSIYEDRSGRFWLGTEGGGLLLFDRAKGELTERFSDEDGLCNNGVLNILEDSTGHLWMSTFNGLSRFDIKTRVFKNYYQSDGLQSNQFSYRAAIPLSTGELVFGGINGFSYFRPSEIIPRSYMPPVYITHILVYGKPLSEVTQYIKRSTNSGITELVVPYDQAVFNFSFNALEFTSPEKIKYGYYLEGWDKNWNFSGNISNINYNNLTEGTYTLHLKSTNVNGEWNDKETQLRLVIRPPWYRSWWAYIIYIVTAAVLVWLFLRYRKQRTQLQYKMKLTELNAEKEKEINEKRQSFFTNITHEFRTPLTLIINPLKDLLSGRQKPDSGDIELVYRNARRLLSLVDQLLLFRKTESETGDLQLSKLDFRQACEESFTFFVQQAKSRDISYRFECPDQLPEIYGDREKLQIVFYNLLSNALKYTPVKGQIEFRIKAGEQTVIAEVADTGRGIPAETGDHLFEKFYQVHKKDTPSKAGFGIGLYLVKQLVEEHHGRIWYESAPGQGTRFFVALQTGHAHFGNIPVGTGPEIPEHEILDEIVAGDEPMPVLKLQTDGLEQVISEKHSILITDDNPQMRSYLVQVFKDDFIVYEAGSGEEAFQIANESQPDIIISDVVMESMSGIEFCKKVKEATALNHIPFILITGSFSPESKLKGIEAGADDYITKPFEKDMLVARVLSLIRKQQNLQKYFYNEITHQQHNLNISGEYKAFLEACIVAVENNLDKDDFTIQVLAQEMGMSHSKLYKKIKAISGQSASSFIRYIRLRKAAELFINSAYNINETAFYVGIKDIKYFREQFTRTFGMKPSEYIEKYRKIHGRIYKLNDKLTRDTE
ncbi:MAG: response regulator [Chitinophagales bacterium]|nr:response regulator [Chitinophagales bacterium]